MFHIFASEVAAVLTFVLFILSLGILRFFDIGWLRAPNTLDVLVLICGCIYACRTTAKGKLCQWPSGVDFTGRVALVVGASSGVGYSTAKQLADHGWTVILASRNTERLLSARKSIEDHLLKRGSKGKVKVLGPVDLRSDASIRAYVRTLVSVKTKLPVGLLVMSAGAMHRHLTFVGEAEELQTGKESVSASTLAWRSMECTIASNAVGPYLFTQLLLPLLSETAEKTSVTSRIVNVASSCHTFLGFGRQSRYDPIAMISGLDERAAEVLARGDMKNEIITSRHPYYIRDFSWFNFVAYYGLSKLCVMWNTRLLTQQVAMMRFTKMSESEAAAIQSASEGAASGAAPKRKTEQPSVSNEDPQLCQKKIFVACTHPGVITTRLYRDLFAPWVLDYLIYYPSLLIGKTWFESAQSTLKAAVEDTDMVQGGYYLCGGEYGPESGVNCVSAHAQSPINLERYYKWMMERVNPALKVQVNDE